jgi:hypothetical protein
MFLPVALAVLLLWSWAWTCQGIQGIQGMGCPRVSFDNSVAIQALLQRPVRFDEEAIITWIQESRHTVCQWHSGCHTVAQVEPPPGRASRAPRYSRYSRYGGDPQVTNPLLVRAHGSCDRGWCQAAESLCVSELNPEGPRQRQRHTRGNQRNKHTQPVPAARSATRCRCCQMQNARRRVGSRGK